MKERMSAPKAVFTFECIGADGKQKWREEVHNLVTLGGRTALLSTMFKGGSQVNPWYLGLKGAGAPDQSDTMASHSGWSEVTPYAGNRKSISFGSAATAMISTDTPVSVAITSAATVAGAFVTSAGTGTSGTLYNVSNFVSPRAVDNGDTLNISLTFSIF